MPVIPSEGEESVNVSETARAVSTSLDMTKEVFTALHVYHADSAFSAAMNMAMDEALLECAAVPSIRFFRWQSPALSFGYFGKFLDIAIYTGKRDLVRRWTGGGIVFHGDDVTYSIVIPASDPAFRESSTTIYEKIHGALAEALNGSGGLAKLLPAALSERGRSRKGHLQIAPAVADRRSLDNDCFANPVRADVMIDGRKIAGAAQRRTPRGLLQQGSIQGFNLDDRLADRFANALSQNCSQLKINEEILQRARELVQQKYGTDSWLRKR